MTGTRADATPFISIDDGLALLEAAVAAPSLHNSQPWRFGIGSRRVEVYADRNRQLRQADPAGRSLLIGCGAALFNLRVAAAHLGFHLRVRILPDTGSPFLVARVDVDHRNTRPEDLGELYPAIPLRRTNRHPFRSLFVPATVLGALIEAAELENARLRVHTDPDEIGRIVDLLHDADSRARSDRDYQAERRRWVGGPTRANGVPLYALGPRPEQPGTPYRDLGTAAVPRGYTRFESTPTIAVLSTVHDEPTDWVRAGQALERVLLVATTAGLSASFANQALEHPDLRWQVHSPLTGVGAAQMIIRLGYGEPVPPTPRRPLTEVRRVLDETPE
jgi:nitroreductase